jgi:hypothetical protein
MSPSRSKTMVRPSGDTSTDMNVPVEVSKLRSFAVARRAETSHRAGIVGDAVGACWAGSWLATRNAKVRARFITGVKRMADGG